VLERPAHEDGAGDDPGQLQVAARLEPDLVESARDVVGNGAGAGFAEGLGPADGGLAGLGEPPHRSAELLGMGERQLALADVRDQPDHPAIIPRSVESFDDGAEHGRAPGDQGLGHRRRRLGQPAREVQLEQEPVPRPAAAHSVAHRAATPRRRALNSASQASARMPIQIGVSAT
jgi:hypothetical protein